jgi:hypothetical protein
MLARCRCAATNARRPLEARAVAPATAARIAMPPFEQQHRRRHGRPLAATGNDKQPAPSSDDNNESEGDWFEGLAPEEDAEVPGGYTEAMSASTRLGKAIRSACDELDTLAALEDQTLREADALLGKLGVKGSLFGAAASGLGSEGGPRDALAALKRAMDEEAQAQAAHERAMAAQREAAEGGDKK